MRRILLFLIFCTLLPLQPVIGQSVLSSGPWYKFAVEKEGVYKLTYSDLQNAGVPLTQVNPKNFRLYGNKGGMIPQPNSADRTFDLSENAIKIIGGEDGSFDSQDYILFYAHGPDKIEYDDEKEMQVYERNIYDTRNYYYLTISAEEGKRLTAAPDLGSGHASVTSYDKLIYVEDDVLNVFSSGREWYGRLNESGNLSLSLPINELTENGHLKIYAELMAQSTGSSSFSISINSYHIGNAEMGVINNYNQPQFTYTERGKIANVTFETDQENIPLGPEYNFTLQFNKAATSISRGYYDKVMIQAEVPLKYESAALLFSSSKSLENGISSYHIAGAEENLMLWNITNHGDVSEQLFSYTNSEISFGSISSELEKYALFNPAIVNNPVLVGTVENQDIKGITTPELLIISNKAFLAEAERLAQLRSQYDGYEVAVTTPEKIYNEFSSGRNDVSAIRDYIKYLFDKSPGKLQYVLLVGKGSYNYTEEETNFFPIYQSRNSLHPLKTYSSDDFYGFLEDDEGEWEENLTEVHTLDVAVGRLPVTTLEEMRQVVNKYFHYSTNSETLGDWKTKMLFVADDGDGNLHNEQAEDLTDYVDTTLKDFQIKKLYLDNYKQITSASTQESPEAREALKRHIENGVFIVNFTGHGGEEKWMDETVLDNDMIESFNNYDKLPLFITATCAFGRQDNPAIKSGAERLLINSTGGAIALVTTSRPVYASSNFYLNNALYEAFNHLQNEEFTLGDLFRETKNNSIKGVDNRNFSLIGDPSLILNDRNLKVEVENINVVDTLKSLQELTIKGVITDKEGIINLGFNGEANITIIDKPVSQKTKGDEYEGSVPFTYKERNSYIFKGSSTVDKGYFETTFIVPVDIDHKIGEGKILAYAYDPEEGLDAMGNHEVLIGGTAVDDFSDSHGPEMQVYMEDTTFRSGDIVGSDALLLIHLKDKSGINISGRSFNSKIAAAFGDEEIELNEYFVSVKDDYKSGWVVYPLEDIKPGKYELLVTASDIYNNSTAASIEFTVTDEDQFEVVELFNAPNPAKDLTSFVYMHNRAGEAMDGELTIFDSQGSKLMNVEFETEEGQVRHKIFDWDCRNTNGIKLVPGVYYYHVNLRSRLDGARAGRFQKLIIRN